MNPILFYFFDNMNPILLKTVLTQEDPVVGLQPMDKSMRKLSGDNNVGPLEGSMLSSLRLKVNYMTGTFMRKRY